MSQTLNFIPGAFMRSFFKAGTLLALILVAGPVQAAVKIQEVSSEKGVEAWLVEDHSLPIITMQFSFDSGAAQDPDGKAGLANLMTGLFDEGAGDLDSDAFQTKMEELGAEMSFNASSDAISGQVRMLSENSDEVLDLVRLAVTSPRFDIDPVERIRSQIAVGIRADERNPSKQGGEALAKALYGDHPYARSTEGTLETLASITPEDLKAFHKRVFGRSNLTIGVVGDIDAERLAAVLDTVFGALPEEAELQVVEDIEPKLGQEVRVDYPLPQTTLRLVYPGIERDDPEFFSAYLMNQILGGGVFSSRLFQEVREKRGLAYGASSYLMSRDHAQSLAIQTATSSEKADETLAVMEEVIAGLRDEGPTQEELDTAKTYVIGSYAINNLDSSTAIARTLVGLQEDDLGVDYIERRADLINAVTLDDVKEAATRLLTQKPALLVVGPAKQGGE
ncbi:pitrilysin family protein [Nitratireductor aquimarinus]|uniref:Pitrilysin family protein n=1 Tax=Nitratireductor aquimarinus TaxID=889300 RepID=A0ABU4ANS6_9HYPH|nr:MULTISPECIES: pitrilysin family protein [Nitratireductor]MBN7763268.1 insulinase family protein [Nitratireductor aquibiodomus]MBN7776019.1 insulinase family protein [Nitratireductor pacificus]MBN7780683.1 insulinase family protein [Nitratireductor pacificus]MBN7789489.1 insulinase family protein [Nitratireductor aquimarinus]MBY6098767.1 insulinase family protein [Nitratireductor aquimarinus]